MKYLENFDMFAWGSTVNGELGLGGIEEENIITPTRLKYSIVDSIGDGKLIIIVTATWFSWYDKFFS